MKTVSINSDLVEGMWKLSKDLNPTWSTLQLSLCISHCTHEWANFTQILPFFFLLKNNIHIWKQNQTYSDVTNGIATKDVHIF